MAIIDFLKKQFIDVIEWTDDSRDTLSFRFPDEDKEIKNGAQLIVRESQVAQFVYLGEFGDTFGPGKHTLTTDNIPILTNLKSWKYALESPFKADVYYVVTRVFAGNKWGTANPVMMRDADFGVVRLRAYGTYDFRVVDPKKFLKEVAGTDDHFRLDEFADAMRSRIVSVFSDALAGAKVPALDVAQRYSELGEALLPLINPAIGAKYGLEMTTFIVENVSVPPEVEQAIDKRSSMAAVGNLNDYVKFQMAQGLEKGGGGPGGMAAEMAVGMAMAQQMMNQTGGVMAQATPGVAPRRPRRRSRAPHAGAGCEGAGRRGGRRHREPRFGRPQGQEDRHAMAGDARGGRCVPERMSEIDRGGAGRRSRSSPACAAGAACGARAGSARDDWCSARRANGSPSSTSRTARRAGRRRARDCRIRVTLPVWTETVRREREPRGALLQRAVTATTFTDSIPGLPPGGSYAVVTFRSSFANQTDSGEEVMLEVGAGYAWRVIGYAISRM